MYPYLRAYLAGIALPTMVIPLVVAGLALYQPATAVSRGGSHHLPDRTCANAWGLWNMFYIWVCRHRELPIGVFGAVLVFLIAPAGFAPAGGADKVVWTPALVAVGLPAYRLLRIAWKHVVARLNDLLGIG